MKSTRKQANSAIALIKLLNGMSIIFLFCFVAGIHDNRSLFISDLYPNAWKYIIIISIILSVILSTICDYKQDKLLTDIYGEDV